ncbi:MAG TPA: DUF1365 domain-containing protein [Caulobacteraceae bacterium]|nr:DUF1365 domain-containing protein [Caulobacteraceae bacterium]
MSEAGALYEGTVVHQRLEPRRHRLSYRLFQLLVDLDALDAPGARLRFFAHNRPALLSLYDRDHLSGDAAPLRPQVEALLAGAGVAFDGGPIRLMCLPRVLGYVFNPLSLYYCHSRDGALAAVVLEVNNTFGERHVYVLAAPAGGGDRVVRLGCAKAFFVSPFLGLDMTYDFRLAVPADRVATAIVARGPDGTPVLSAAFEGARRTLDDRAIASAMLRHPLVTLKVIAAIHWEAAKLFAKGVGLRAKPAPGSAVTVIGRTAERAVA